MSLGIWQLVLILAIILIFFGAGKLPNVMRDVGKSVKGLKEGMKDDEKDKEIDKSKIDDGRKENSKKN